MVDAGPEPMYAEKNESTPHPPPPCHHLGNDIDDIRYKHTLNKLGFTGPRTSESMITVRR